MKPWPSALAALLAAAAACAPAAPGRAPAPLPAPLPPGAPPAAPPAPAAPPVAVPDAVSTLATAVSVGLVVDSATAEIGADDEFVVRAPGGREVARLRAGETARFGADGGGITLTAGGRTQRGLSAPLTVESPSGFLRLRNAPYRGVFLVQRGTRGGVTIANRLDMESYLLGVVPKEIGRVGPELLEAAKAQAVAARTYAAKYLGRRRAQGFDVYATVEDQVYGGIAGETAIVSGAVLATAGEVLTYNGQPITAYYHSTCAGQTAAIEEVWNESPAPYLVSVRDVDPAGEAYDRSSSRFQWTERWTGPELVSTLNRTLADSLGMRRISQVRDMRVVQRTPSGRVRAMTIDTDVGRFTVGKDRVRWILPPTRGGILNSSKFDVQRTADGGVVATGGGWGHGIGMCQVGAMGRARAGQDYRRILAVYYPNTRLEKLY